jgi:hypothetical protein
LLDIVEHIPTGYCVERSFDRILLSGLGADIVEQLNIVEWRNWLRALDIVERFAPDIVERSILLSDSWWGLILLSIGMLSVLADIVERSPSPEFPNFLNCRQIPLSPLVVSVLRNPFPGFFATICGGSAARRVSLFGGPYPITLNELVEKVRQPLPRALEFRRRFGAH